MSDLQTLTLPFRLSSDNRSGVVTVTLKSNQDPQQYGLDILFPDVPVQSMAGFPACKATVKSHMDGYASMFGWVQQVKEDEGVFYRDPAPLFEDVNSPFVWFGPEPTLFDAPLRVELKPLVWVCHSFLAYTPDCLLSKNVIPIIGFEWGFEIDEGKIRITRLKELGAEWNGHLNRLRAEHPGWQFSEFAAQKKDVNSEDRDD